MNAFKVLDLIGEGAYARVHKGVHIATNTPVAIKFMKQPCQSIEQARLLPEVIALSKLQSTNKCRNIVSLKSVIVENDQAILVLEHMPCDLLTLLRTSLQGFNEAVVSIIIKQLLTAIAHCHLYGIIHRDIKLENILIDAPGLIQWLQSQASSADNHTAAQFLSSLSDLSLIRVVLADFGESRSVRTCRGSDAHAGTLWSRAPEQLQHQTYSSPIDMWSIGCITAELLSGRSLFAADSESAVLSRISNVLGCNTSFTHSNQLRHFDSQREMIPSSVNSDRLRLCFPRSSLSSSQFLSRVFDVNMYTRLKASEALSHPFIQNIQPIKPSVVIRPGTAQPRMESAITSKPPTSSLVNLNMAPALQSTYSYRPTTAFSMPLDGYRNRTRLTTAASILR